MRTRPRCVLALVVALTAAVAPAQSPAGDWTGTIAVPGSPLYVKVHLEQAGGSWRGSIDIPAQGAEALPLERIAVDGTEVTFAIAGVPGKPTFRGTLDAAAGKLTGDFTQGGGQMTFALQCADAAAAAGAATAVNRLAGYDDWLGSVRKQFHVPGCAVAVVKDDHLLTTFASGMRDVENDLPATADTLFAIGSSTKAFTTFVLATLVDDGKLDWDKPVRTWLPEFALADENVAAHLTPRDLVTHRSGMPRHDLVWYGAEFTRAEMVARMRWLPLNKDLRTDFQYNNLMFLCAGHLAERITGASWEDLVRQRILEPLHMQRTNFAVRDSQRDADHAEPYRKRPQVNGVDHIAFRECSAIGPAGSINSSVREMADWVALQLHDGTYGGQHLLTATTAKDLHQARIPMELPRRSAEIVEVGYALGWMVDVYRGHRRVHHGGNIDGFSAMVTLLPDDGYGFVALANLDSTPVPELAVRNLCDRLLQLAPHDWRSEVQERLQATEASVQKGKENDAGERRPGTKPSHDLAEFAGTYADAGYGRCSVQLREGALHVDFHGLGAPLEHWHFDVFRCMASKDTPEIEGMKVQFVTGFDGEVEAVRAVLDPNVEPIVFRREPDARLHDPAFLRSLAGDYQLDGQIATFTVQGNELTVTMPGQHYRLLPRQGLAFDLATLHGYSVRFVLDDAGVPTAVRFRQPEGVFEGKRKPD